MPFSKQLPRIMVILVACLLLSSFLNSQPKTRTRSAVEVLSLWMKEPSVQILIMASDEKTKDLVNEFTVSARYLDRQGAMGGSATGSGVVRVGLSGGNFAVVVSAEGYDDEVIDSVRVPGKSAVAEFSTFPMYGCDPFSGTTISYGVLMRRMDPLVGKRQRVRQFFDDNTYYYKTSPPPELLGGLQSVVNLMTREAKEVWPEASGSIDVNTGCTAFVNKYGKVDSVQTQAYVKKEVAELIRSTVLKCTFKPGLILGRPVNAQLYIPFSLNLKNPLLKWGREHLSFSPLTGKTSRDAIIGYGMKLHPILNAQRMHEGVDFTVDTGTQVVATGDGRVVDAGNSTEGFGLFVTIRHSEGYQTFYAHLSKIAVSKEEQVKQGQVVGYSGNTGLSTEPNLHYAVFKNGRSLDPAEFLPQK